MYIFEQYKENLLYKIQNNAMYEYYNSLSKISIIITMQFAVKYDTKGCMYFN